MSEKVDVSKLHEGDFVLVRGKIDDRGYIVCDNEDGGASHLLVELKYDIVSVEPRPLKAGDRARMTDFLPDFRIIAVDEGVAWVRSDAGAQHLFPLRELKRV